MPSLHCTNTLSQALHLCHLLEYGRELAQIPGDARVKEGVGLVGAVDRGLVAERLPVLRLDLQVGALARTARALLHPEVLQQLARLADVLQLVVAILPVDILFDRCCITRKTR